MSDIDRIEAHPVYCPECGTERLPLVNAAGDIRCGMGHFVGSLFADDESPEWGSDYHGDHQYTGVEDMPEIDLDEEE